MGMGFANGMSVTDQQEILTRFEVFLSANGLNLLDSENILAENNSDFSTLDLAYLFTSSGDYQTAATELKINNPVVMGIVGPEIMVTPKWWKDWKVWVGLGLFLLIIFLSFKAFKK